jgi:hypothetical protein
MVSSRRRRRPLRYGASTRVLTWILLLPLIGALAGAGSACSTGSTVEPPPADTTGPVTYVPGQSYYGENGYVEYIAGELPIILSAGHGGHLTPASIPDRTADRCGGSATTVTDRNTREMTLAMRDAIVDHFGGEPHVIISHLHRRKLDPNRELAEAACGNAAAAQAWRDYHGFIDLARAAAAEAHGRGWYMDIHGHGHPYQRLELGYLLRSADLQLDDDALAAQDGYLRRSSLNSLLPSADLFPALLRGEESLGALYHQHGFPAVPSPVYPDPGEEPFFSGGYSTVRHACAENAYLHGGHAGGPVCGVQVEANFDGVRDTDENRAAFAAATAAILETFLAAIWAGAAVP